MNTNNGSEVQTAPDGVKVKLMTTRELAASLGVDYVKASGLVAVLAEQGAINKVGTRPPDGGRGKPSDVFEFPESIELCFWQDGEIGMPEAPEIEPISSEVISPAPDVEPVEVQPITVLNPVTISENLVDPAAKSQ